MILAFLLAAAVPQTAVEAERAFAAMAQTQGQWTAFRAFAVPDGIMFVPQAVNARQWLTDRKDPPVAVMWWPARAILSCDGNTAVTTGPWVRSGGSLKGYFTTVWQRQADGGWKWLLDHGDALAAPRVAPDRVAIERPDCGSRAGLTKAGEALVPSEGEGSGVRAAGDGTLRWAWRVEANGGRVFEAQVWDGKAYRSAVLDRVAASQ